MYLASLSELPSMPVFLTRSEPARSTRCSLERRTTSLPALRRSMAMVKRQCEREEAWFIGVSEMTRLVSPRKSRLSASSSVRASWAERLRRCIRPSSSSSRLTCSAGAGSGSGAGAGAGSGSRPGTRLESESA